MQKQNRSKHLCYIAFGLGQEQKFQQKDTIGKSTQRGHTHTHTQHLCPCWLEVVAAAVEEEEEEEGGEVSQRQAHLCWEEAEPGARCQTLFWHPGPETLQLAADY